MSTKEDIVDGFLSRDLFMLAMAFKDCDESHFQSLFEVIQEETGVKLENVTDLYEMSGKDIQTLHAMERRKKTFFIAMIDKYPTKPPTPKFNPSNCRYLLGILLIVLSLLYIFATSFFSIPEENRRIVDTTIGAVTSLVLSTVVSYYFPGNTADKNKESPKK